MHKFIMVATICLFAEVASGNSTEAIAELNRQKECITGLQNAEHRLLWIHETWLLNPDNGVNVLSAFESLVGQHAAYNASIERFVKESLQIPDSITALAGLSMQLDQGFAANLADLSAVGEADDRFLESIAAIDQTLAESAGRYVGLSAKCEGFAEDLIADVTEGTDDLRQQLENMQVYVAESDLKRSSLFRAALAKIKVDLTERFAAAQLIELESVYAKINQINAVDDLAARIDSWWFRAAVQKGLGDGLSGLPLQFQSPLRIMRADLTAGQTLEKELAQLGAPRVILAPIKAKLAGYLGRLEEEVKSLEEIGADGFHKLRKDMAGRRREVLDSYGPECKAALETFDVATVAAESAADFRLSEQAYISVVMLCKRRGS